MTRRTSMNLDFDLVDEAKRILGTTETTETVHRTLRAVVRLERREWLARRRFDLDLEALRRSRTSD